MKTRTYFIAHSKETNQSIISTTKAGIAGFLGISSKTIYRHLMNNDKYECDKYIIYKNIPMIKRVRHKLGRWKR